MVIHMTKPLADGTMPRDDIAMSWDDALQRRILLRDLVRLQREHCHYCAKPFGKGRRAATLDEKVPRWMGGTLTRSNIVAACHACNQLKGPMDAETFMEVKHDPTRLRLERSKAEVAAHQASDAMKRKTG